MLCVGVSVLDNLTGGILKQLLNFINNGCFMKAQISIGNVPDRHLL